MDTKTFIEIAAFLFGLVGGWFTLKNQVLRLEEKMRDQKDEGNETHQNLWKVVGNIRDNQEKHLADSSIRRLEIEKEFGILRNNHGIVQVQMTELKSKMDDLLDMVKEIRERVK